MKYTRLLWLMVLIQIGVPSQSAAEETGAGRYGIHVITLGPGEDLFSRFGHIAMMVEDRERHQRTVYNYGTFDFNDPALRIRYARGFLNYWLSTADFSSFMMFYERLDRDIWITTLNLLPQESEDIARALRQNALPENREYAYRHYLDNCCTRIRDMIDAHLDGIIERRFSQERVARTFRHWTAASLRGFILYKYVILYSLGPAVDVDITRYDEQFLPAVLHADLQKVSLSDGRSLVSRDLQVNRRRGPPIGATTPIIDWVVALVLMGILLLGVFVPALPGAWWWQARTRLLGMGMIVWGLLAGLGGLMLLVYWMGTTHYDTHYNENILINPVTHLWLVVPGIRLLVRKQMPVGWYRMTMAYLAACTLIVLVSLLLKWGPFIQDNYGVIAVALFCNIVGMVALRKRMMAPFVSR